MCAAQQGLCCLLSVIVRAEMLQILQQFHARASVQCFIQAASRFQMSDEGMCSLQTIPCIHFC